MKTSIVLGTLFGDEGKGLTTSFLSQPGNLVVRFNGGHQAGHTVVKNGFRHVFSSFGSGTLNGADTYWSEYCTFYPRSFYNEQKCLRENGYKCMHYIHPLSLVTTPFDIDFNRALEGANKHGSVGMGFGATIARNQDTPFKLYAVDLINRNLLVHKLNQIAQYYESVNVAEQIERFLFYVDNINLNICTLADILRLQPYNHIIFEGAQGIMLDMDFGYFPNVTRSNTTSKNALQIIKENNLPVPQIYYTIRSYLTRHGNGFMPNECSQLSFEDKTNVSHKYQGNFRQGYHCLDQLNYAIQCDSAFSGMNFDKKHLVISCMDQTDGMILLDNQKISIIEFLTKKLPTFNRILINDSPNVETMRLFGNSKLKEINKSLLHSA